MKTQQRSNWYKLARIFRPLNHLLDRLLRLKTSRIVWRLMTLATLVLLIFAATVLSRVQNTLLVDQTKIPALVQVEQPEGTVDLVTYSGHIIDALDESGILVGDHDLLSLPEDQPLMPGQTYHLAITRRSEFTLLWSGLAISAVSEPLSSVDLMSRSGYDNIDLSDGSRVEQLADDTLAYVAVDKKEFRITEKIKYSSVFVDDPDLEIGKTKVATPGQNGTRDLIFEDTYENGVFLNRVQVGTEITLDPVQEVISRGTKVVIKPIDRRRVGSTVLSSFDQIKPLLNKNGKMNYLSFSDNGNGTITVDGKTFDYTSVSKRRITAFDGLEVCVNTGCHSPAKNHNTASGVPAQRGLVATYGQHIDGKVYPTLPMGTIVFIEGYGLGVVADLHGVSSNHELLDACYDPGETLSGAALSTGNRTSYILYVPK